MTNITPKNIVLIILIFIVLELITYHYKEHRIKKTMLEVREILHPSK